MLSKAAGRGMFEDYFENKPFASNQETLEESEQKIKDIERMAILIRKFPFPISDNDKEEQKTLKDLMGKYFRFTEMKEKVGGSFPLKTFADYLDNQVSEWRQQLNAAKEGIKVSSLIDLDISTSKTMALLDVDNTLVDSESNLNENLLSVLESMGIKDISLLTSMSAKALLEEKTYGSSAKTLTRGELIKELESRGFTIHHVITPIDPIYKYFTESKKSPFEEMLKELYEGEQYQIILKGPMGLISQDNISENKIYADYQFVRARWDYYDLLMNLTNNLIRLKAEERPEDFKALLQFLDHGKNQLIARLDNLPAKYINSDNKENVVLQFKDRLAAELSPVLEELTKIAESENTQSVIKKAKEFILKLPWAKSSPWLKDNKLDLVNFYPSQWDKGSMYAYSLEGNLFKGFNNFIYFDDKKECLETVKEVHQRLGANKKGIMLQNIEVKFSREKDEAAYYVKQFKIFEDDDINIKFGQLLEAIIELKKLIKSNPKETDNSNKNILGSQFINWLDILPKRLVEEALIAKKNNASLPSSVSPTIDFFNELLNKEIQNLTNGKNASARFLKESINKFDKQFIGKPLRSQKIKAAISGVLKAFMDYISGTKKIIPKVVDGKFEVIRKRTTPKTELKPASLATGNTFFNHPQNKNKTNQSQEASEVFQSGPSKPKENR